MITALLAWSAGAADTVPTCAELATSYVKQVRERPEVQPQLWWVTATPPCPSGTRNAGAPPPEGNDLWCEDGRGRRSGLRTTFDANGHVRSESTWIRDREIGPRLEWDTDHDVVSRMSKFDDDGLLGGETVEWGADGSTTVTEYQRGQKDGMSWRMDERGQLVLAEQWRGGVRNGRSCTWRDGHVELDQVWVAGDPATSG
jgi:hypothetical protein